jgi:hypothetical protein
VPRPIPPPVPVERELNERDRPWIGVKVLVIKKGHQRKGQPAVVHDVLPSQSTASGLKVQVRFENYDPSAPYHKAIFDYDDLIEFEYVF